MVFMCRTAAKMNVQIPCSGKFLHGANSGSFADDPNATKIKTCESFNNSVGTTLCM